MGRGALRTGLAASALVGWLALPGRAEIRPGYGGVVDASLLGAPVSFDPVTAQGHADVTVVSLVFDTLYALKPDGTVEPHLALGSPELNPAHSVAHVAVRPGVTFHDGSALTASDVAASLERTRTAAGSVLAPVAQVRVAGDGVDLVLRNPDAELAMLLALPQTAITPRGQAPAARPVGSGPFAVDSLDRAKRRLVLRAFDSHFAGRPYLDQLVLGWSDDPDDEARRFETGVAQLSARGETTFVGTRPRYPADQLESSLALLVFVGFGKQHPQITGDPAFRKALDLALDRDSISKVTRGEHARPTRLPLPTTAGGAVLDDAVGDVDAASAQLAAGRNPALTAANRASLRLTIVHDKTRPDDHEIAQRVARGLQKLGIGFIIDTLEPEVARARVRRGECDLWIGQIAAPNAFASAWWGAAFDAGGDSWAATKLARAPINRVPPEFASRLPIVPLMFRSLQVWYRSEVHGLDFDPSARPGLADLYWFIKDKKSRPKGAP